MHCKNNKKSLLSYEEDYNFLQDSPLNPSSGEPVKFGHEKIANVLSDTIIRSTPPFTIGLFGNWGVGKSTIIEHIQENLNNNKIRTVFFDAWKYKGDSLRRQFLICIDEQLTLKKDFKKTLNQSLTETVSLPLSKTLQILFDQILVKTLVVLFVFAIIAAITSYWFSENIDAIITFTLQIGVLTLFISFILRSLQIVTGSVNTNKTDSAEGFESIFKDIISEIKDKKILFVIDNLDRVPGDKAIELLSDIKTFLATNDLSKIKTERKSVFLIACDENAISKPLLRAGFNEPKEFLRKFFNTTFTIPQFLSTDLEEYVQEKLNETQVISFKNNQDLKWLLTYTFRNNPREIKQFINSLITNFLIAKEMEECGNIAKKGSVTNSVDALAKINIIKEKYPLMMNKMEKRIITEALTWQDFVNESIKLYEEQIENISSNQQKEMWSNELKNYQVFLERTDHIGIPNLTTFISLRQSSQELDLPGIAEFLILANDGILDKAKVISDQYSKEKTKSLDIILAKHLQEGTEKKEDRHIFAITCLNILKEQITDFPEFVNEFMLNFPTTDTLYKYISKYYPSFIFKYIYPNINNSFKEKIITSYTELFRYRPDKGQPLTTNKEVDEDLIITVCTYWKEFKQHTSIITEGISQSLYYYEKYLQIILDAGLADELIINKTKLNYISLINFETTTEIEPFKKKITLFNNLDLSEVAESQIGQINYIIHQIDKLGLGSDYQALILNALQKALQYEETTNFLKGGGSPIAEEITNSIVNWYNNNLDSIIQLKCFDIIYDLRLLENNHIINLSDNVITAFINTHLTVNLWNEFSQEKKETIGVNFSNILFNKLRSNMDLDLLLAIHPVLPQDKIDTLIAYNAERSSDFVPEIITKTGHSNIIDKIGILNKLLNIQAQLDINLQKQYLDIIAKMKCGNDPEITQRFYAALMNLKPTHPEVAKKYSKRPFFGSDQKRNLAEEIKE